MHLDPSAYLRIDAHQSIDVTASGASFATSTGDILEVSSFGEGVFRVRMGPRTLPDYGIIQQPAQHCGVTPGSKWPWRFTAGDAMLEIGGAPLRFRLFWKTRPIFGSITDQHFRGFTRLPNFGRLRQGGLWTAAFALRSGEGVYGLGEKFGPLNKRGQLIHSQVEDALGVNTGLSYKNTLRPPPARACRCVARPPRRD